MFGMYQEDKVGAYNEIMEATIFRELIDRETRLLYKLADEFGGKFEQVAQEPVRSEEEKFIERMTEFGSKPRLFKGSKYAMMPYLDLDLAKPREPENNFEYCNFREILEEQNKKEQVQTQSQEHYCRNDISDPKYPTRLAYGLYEYVRDDIRANKKYVTSFVDAMHVTCKIRSNAFQYLELHLPGSRFLRSRNFIAEEINKYFNRFLDIAIANQFKPRKIDPDEFVTPIPTTSTAATAATAATAETMDTTENTENTETTETMDTTETAEATENTETTETMDTTKTAEATETTEVTAETSAGSKNRVRKTTYKNIPDTKILNGHVVKEKIIKGKHIEKFSHYIYNNAGKDHKIKYIIDKKGNRWISTTSLWKVVRKSMCSESIRNLVEKKNRVMIYGKESCKWIGLNLDGIKQFFTHHMFNDCDAFKAFVLNL